MCCFASHKLWMNGTVMGGVSPWLIPASSAACVRVERKHHRRPKSSSSSSPTCQSRLPLWEVSRKIYDDRGYKAGPSTDGERGGLATIPVLRFRPAPGWLFVGTERPRMQRRARAASIDRRSPVPHRLRRRGGSGRDEGRKTRQWLCVRARAPEPCTFACIYRTPTR